MSLTTENSLDRNRRDSTWSRCVFKKLCCCPCLPKLRKVSPVNQLPHNSEFMTLGTKGKRIICVVHIDPYLRDSVFTLSGTSLAVQAKKVVCDDNDSEISSDEYWFTKWTIPLRTVKYFQNQNLPKQNIISFIKNHLPNNPSPARNEENPVAVGQSAAINQQASEELSHVSSRKPEDETRSENEIQPSTPQDGGIVNLGFMGSRFDPDATVPSKNPVSVTQLKPQTHSKPLLYFIHGAGESTASWRNIMEYFVNLDYEVVALDLIGHGYSYTPKREKCYVFKKILGDVISVFDAHVFSGRKAVVIAHGYGCSFGVALSRQRGNNITLLALISCGGPTPLAPPVSWRRELKLPASLLRCLRSLLPCGIKRSIFYGPRGKNCLHNTVDFQSLPSYVQRNLALGQSWMEGDVAFHRKIVVPTLLVHGLKDKFVSLVEMCEMERVNIDL